jgi:hypothetical protein
LSTKDKTIELYNLAEDLGETKNLAKTYPERTAEMKAELLKWESNISKNLPYTVGKPRLP